MQIIHNDDASLINIVMKFIDKYLKKSDSNLRSIFSDNISSKKASPVTVTFSIIFVDFVHESLFPPRFKSFWVLKQKYLSPI